MAIERSFTFSGNEYDSTLYRLRPNPDNASSNTFEFGGVLEWTDDGGKTWCGHFFMDKDSMKQLGTILTEMID